MVMAFTDGSDCWCLLSIAVSLACSRSLRVSLLEENFKLNSNVISLYLANMLWWVFSSKTLPSDSGGQPSETAKAYIILGSLGSPNLIVFPAHIHLLLSLFKTLHPTYYLSTFILHDTALSLVLLITTTDIFWHFMDCILFLFKLIE